MRVRDGEETDMTTAGAAAEEKRDLEAAVQKARDSSAIFPPNRCGPAVSWTLFFLSLVFNFVCDVPF